MNRIHRKLNCARVGFVLFLATLFLVRTLYEYDVVHTVVDGDRFRSSDYSVRERRMVLSFSNLTGWNEILDSVGRDNCPHENWRANLCVSFFRCDDETDERGREYAAKHLAGLAAAEDEEYEWYVYVPSGLNESCPIRLPDRSDPDTVYVSYGGVLAATLNDFLVATDVTRRLICDSEFWAGALTDEDDPDGVMRKNYLLTKRLEHTFYDDEESKIEADVVCSSQPFEK